MENNIVEEKVVTEEKHEEVKPAKEEKKENNKILDFFIKTLNGMAYGLFATLIVGTIFGALGLLFAQGNDVFCKTMVEILGNNGAGGISKVLQLLTGAGIGVGIALSLKFDPLKTIVLAAVGEIAAFFSLSASLDPSIVFTYNDNFKIGDPLTIYIVCIAVALTMNYVLKKKTPVDIIVVPLFGVAVATVLSLGVRYPTVCITFAFQWLINNGTTIIPFVMGIVVSVLMGMALTAPISSAAIAFMIFNIANTTSADYSGLMLASSAAIVGCSTQMVGFAIMSRKDNNIGTVISVGIGTSMLQFKNILKKPVIWLPTIIASAILGPIATCLVPFSCEGASAGMGTAGLVGQIGTFISTGADKWETYVGVFVLQIIAPAILVFFIDLVFRKFGWIKEGDLTI